MGLGSLKWPLTFYIIGYCYEHGLGLMTSQRFLLSVSGGLELHSWITQVEFMSGWGFILLVYEYFVNQWCWYLAYYMVILL